MNEWPRWVQWVVALGLAVLGDSVVSDARKGLESVFGREVVRFIYIAAGFTAMALGGGAIARLLGVK